MKTDISVSITFPVFNEERVLEKNILKFYNFLEKLKFPYKFEIVISDSGSSDNTSKIGKKLEKEVDEVTYIHTGRKSKSYAIKNSWRQTKCDIVSYLDIDLATNLKFFLPLINKIVKENYDLAIGCRLGKNSKVINRKFSRSLLSKCYNLLLNILFFHKIKDHQCGFKAMKRNKFLIIDKQILDIKEIFFLDTELIIRAIKNKMRVGEVDVIWLDDRDSKVNVLKTVAENLKGVVRLKKEFIMNFPNEKNTNERR